jgi:hypothetical protein
MYIHNTRTMIKNKKDGVVIVTHRKTNDIIFVLVFKIQFFFMHDWLYNMRKSN